MPAKDKKYADWMTEKVIKHISYDHMVETGIVMFLPNFFIKISI